MNQSPQEGANLCPPIGREAAQAVLQGIGLAGKKDNVVIVAAREQAQLVVEVNAVRTANMADDDLLNDEFWVSVLVKPGPQLSARFGTVPRTYRFLQVTRLAPPTDAEGTAQSPSR